MLSKTRKISLITLMLITYFNSILNAAPVSWQNLGTGSWENGAFWFGINTPPAAGDTAVISNGGDAQLSSATPSLTQVNIQAPSKVDVLSGGVLNSSTFFIDVSGSGGLNITGGGIANANSVTIKTTNPSSPSVNVDGSGSQLNVGSSIIVGNLGDGKLTIKNNGQVNATSSGVIFGSSTGTTGILELDSSGVLFTSLLTSGAGSADVNFAGGILRASQNQANFINFSSGQLNILSGGAFVDSQSFNIDTSNGFTGVGALNKLGSGTFTLNGNSTNNGANVQAGTLVVNGSFLGPTSVSPSAILAVNGLLNGDISNSGKLMGTGTVGSINNSGTVAPGNSIGTLAVTGNFVNNSNGILENEINAAGQTDLLQVGGTATLNGGTLEVIGAPGNYIDGTKYTILTAAGGLSGTFANYTNNLPIRSFLTYLPNALILNLGNPISDLTGLRGNSLRVANYINSFPSSLLNGDFSSVILALDSLDPSELSAALSQLDPAPFQAVALTAGDAAYLITEGFTDRLNYLRRRDLCNPCCHPCEERGAWITGVADFLRQSRTDGLRRFNADTQGIAFGFDRCICDSTIAGLGIGYTHSHIKWSHSYGHTNVNSGYVGAYATRYTQNYYIDGALLGFINNNKARRHIEFSTIDRKAKSCYYSSGVNPHLGLGWFADFCTLTLIPYFEADYYYIHQNKFHEHGANSLNLHVKKNNASLLRLETGVNFTKCFAFNCGNLIPNLSLGYVANCILGGKKYRSSFNDAPTYFSAYGTDHCFNQFEVGFDVTYLYNDCLGFNLGYEAEIGEKRHEQELNLNVNFRF